MSANFRSALSSWPEPLRILFTLEIGVIGAYLAKYLQLPVPALLGSSILVALIALQKVPVTMPLYMRNLGFTILGASMGSAITRDMLALIGRWPLSLAILVIAVGLMMLSSTYLLSRYFKQSRHTAFLASAPGALSTTIALANAGYANLNSVVVFQGLRLLIVMAVLPIMIHSLDLNGTTTLAKLSTTLSWQAVLGTLSGAFALALLFQALKIPSAFILGGLCFSASLHVGNWLSGSLPPLLITLGFLIIGCTIGERFQAISFPQLRESAVAATFTVLLSSLIAALMATVAALSLDLPFGQVWIAYAPGGIEAMAALAMAMHYDPAYIAAHHLFRIIGLTLFMPIILRTLKN
ncbi:AbrB family transcriptional regulator [Thiolinea disciformis]|uniref:AbrB family transcriptional regulator n=1 Tax=Thiolinea disciformis TaxID=125614 RepID=UPI00036C200C|nr:AbrB family transcriptional regulator [Thiolinea disciformis]